MKYYIVAGEASGDLHGSNLIAGIRQADPQASFRGFGGDLMAKEGTEIVKHYSSMAFMGFIEVISNFKSIKANLNLCKEDIKRHKPDVIILIDYPGFNMRIARFAKNAGYKVFYYIAPKVWAWNEGRVKNIRAYVDKLFVIFPFEVDYFRKHGIDAIYEGNPLLDSVSQGQASIASPDDFRSKHSLSTKPIITLMAGSRKQEIKYNLPIMLTLVKELTNYQFVIAGAPSLQPSIYYQHIAGKDIKLIYGQTAELLSYSSIAIVTSGTATLEAALYGMPQVVCYRNSLTSMLIAWMVVKVKYISLVNLVMQREVVKELVQYKLTPATLLHQAMQILPNKPNRNIMLNNYHELQNLMGTEGASVRVGKRIVNTLNN
jgi:lipid-A-disaccharide synthase